MKLKIFERDRRTLGDLASGSAFKFVGKPDVYQVLSLDNGVVTFNLIGGFPSYTVSLTGGSYTVVSGETSQWFSGWSITPELYCEVGPR